MCQFYDIRKEKTFNSREKYKANFVPKDYVLIFFSNRNYYSLTFFLNRYNCTYVFLLISYLQQSHIKTCQTDMQKFAVMAFTRSKFSASISIIQANQNVNEFVSHLYEFLQLIFTITSRIAEQVGRNEQQKCMRDEKLLGFNVTLYIHVHILGQES